MPIPREIQETLTTGLLQLELAAMEHEEAYAPRRSAAELVSDQCRMERAENELQDAIARRDYRPAHALLTFVARLSEIELDPADPGWPVANRKGIRVLAEAQAEKSRRARGEFREPSPAFRRVCGGDEVASVHDPLGLEEKLDEDDNATLIRYRSIRAAWHPEACLKYEKIVTATETMTRDAIARVAAWAKAEGLEFHVDRAATSVAAKREKLGPRVRANLELLVAAEAQGDPIFPSDSRFDACFGGAPPANDEAGARHAPHAPSARNRGAGGKSDRKPPHADPAPSDTVPDEADIAREQPARTGEPGLARGFDIYFTKRGQGYSDGFGEEEVPEKIVGQKWIRSSGGAAKCAKRLWVDLLGDRSASTIPAEEIRDAKWVLRRIPDHHGRSPQETRNIRELVKETSRREDRQIADAKERALRGNLSPAAAEREVMEAGIPRIRVETYVKHLRILNRVGKMLEKLGYIEKNPFQPHMLTARERRILERAQTKRDRRPWDDRIYDLLATPIFRGDLDDVGDPLFWAPLMALLGGGREEAILQLPPEAFQQENGIHYYTIWNRPGESVKSEAGLRKIPVHPLLIELGLLRLVKMRLDAGEPRLFPFLKRGKTRDTFSERFTKRFTLYRKAHKVYWIGLDFLALRTTFHHRLIDLGTPGYIKRYLMGHAPGDQGERSYSQGGISTGQLARWINGIDYDLSGVVSPFDAVPSGKG